jgi:hypothetical protein
MLQRQVNNSDMEKSRSTSKSKAKAPAKKASAGKGKTVTVTATARATKSRAKVVLPTEDDIRVKAQELYSERIANGLTGSAEDDWLKAESLLRK